ncbi:MAG: hypothetical protein RBT22_08385 [Aliarcobacter sp.]|nr:hypothetical protein [Aliarcobacter sp.]
MKKNLILLVMLVVGISFSGCSRKDIPIPKSSIDKDKDGIIHLYTGRNDNLFYEDLDDDRVERIQRSYRRNEDVLRRALIEASEYTIKERKTHFAIVNDGTNHLIGFPINTFQNLKDYCFKFDREQNTIKVGCSFMLPGNSVTHLKIVLLENTPDYKSNAIEAKRMLAELSAFPANRKIEDVLKEYKIEKK